MNKPICSRPNCKMEREHHFIIIRIKTKQKGYGYIKVNMCMYLIDVPIGKYVDVVNGIIAKHLLQSNEPIVKFNFIEPRLT